MKEKKKLIIATVLVLIVMIGTIGLAFAMFMYENTGGKSKLVLGDIWMKYREVEGISLSNALPGDPYSDYFEFTIEGKNTYEEKDIWYEIILRNGDVPSGKLEENRMRANYLKFKLVEVINDNEEKIIFEDKEFSDSFYTFDNSVIYQTNIPKNTAYEYNKTYRLYMRVSDYIEIVDADTIASGYCNGIECVTPEDYQNLFASVKVEVKGDLNLKQMPRTIARLGTSDTKFWSDDIMNVKENIKEVNFLKLSSEEIDTRFTNANIKSDVTTVTNYPIKTWLEENDTDSSMYTMYIASEDEMYFPSESSYMFYYFPNIEIISFDNINTSQVTVMTAMFGDNNNLKEIRGLEKFDTSKVISMSNMFQGTNLTSLDLSGWDTSKLIYISQMFYLCNSLANLDISNFTFDKVKGNNYAFFNVGSNLPAGTYTTVYVKPDYVLDGTTYSPQTWILNLNKNNRPSGWSNANVIVKQ